MQRKLSRALKNSLLNTQGQYKWQYPGQLWALEKGYAQIAYKIKKAIVKGHYSSMWQNKYGYLSILWKEIER